MKNASYILIIFFALALFSCETEPQKNSEGFIEYNVSYPKMKKDNFMLGIMPKKMVMKFKQDKYITTLSAGMGMFKTNFICDKNEERFSQLVKLISKKYVLELEGDAILNSLKNQPKFDIEFTNERKSILGYSCKKAIITINNDEHETFTVFYTDQINLESPNWCNQFAPINGVMLEYQYEKYGVCTRFLATKIQFEKISDEEFNIPEDYELISEADMDKEMQEIFDSFN